jgi:hypothetical protein
MQTRTPEKVDELIQSFQRDSVNKAYALNFILGTLSSQVQRGETLTAEKLFNILESALRFSKNRK